MDPIVARGFVDLGFDTKEKLIDWLAENALMTAREYWDNQWIQTLIRPKAVLGTEPFASYLDAPPDEPLQLFRPEDITVTVVGGETGGTWKMIAGALRDNVVSIDDWR
jgi:hypothetical protein